MDDGNYQSLFEDNELVWAKTVGYPWWPGIITAYPQETGDLCYKVEYLGSLSLQYFCKLSRSVLTPNEIVKFSDFDIKGNIGRPSPELKRAIHEASDIYSALQQSQKGINSQKIYKTSANNIQIILNQSMKPTFDYQNQASSVNDQPNDIKTVLKSSISAFKHKNIKKWEKKPTKIKSKFKEQNKKLKKDKGFGQKGSRVRVNELLRVYKLDRIPKPDQHHKNIDLNALICRKVYRLLKLRGYDRKQGHSLARKIGQKIHGKKDLRRYTHKVQKQEIEEEEQQSQKQQYLDIPPTQMFSLPESAIY